MHTNLPTRWHHLLRSFTDQEEKISSLWEEIKHHYEEKHRHYHNLTHIQDLLQQAEIYQAHLAEYDILQFAIWYHDIIYNTIRKDNEEKSAALAEKRLTDLRVSPARRHQCAILILATKTHRLEANDLTEDVKWMIDFDLSILGRPWETYQQYAEQIRQEYRLVPTLLYKRGRKKALKNFLASDHIYHTDVYREKYEAIARDNLKRELSHL